MYLLLIFGEQCRLVEPSSSASIYFLLTSILDLVRWRTSWLVRGYSPVSTAGVLSVICRVVLSLFEIYRTLISISKVDRPLTRKADGLRHRLSHFVWRVFQLVWRRRTLPITPHDLPPLQDDMKAARLEGEFYYFHHQFRAGSHPSLKATISALRWDVGVAALPRLILLGLTLCQPVLADVLLNYLAQSPHQYDYPLQRVLIGAYAFTYIGIAVSSTLYGYLRARFLAMMRTTLASAVHCKTTRLSLPRATDSQMGLSIISADLYRINVGFTYLHDVWANVIQISVATYLLQRQLGGACIVPLILAFGSALSSIGIGRSSTATQQKWMQAVEARIGVTSGALSTFKSIKMQGAYVAISERLSILRLAELHAAGFFRMRIVWTSLAAFVPNFLVPVVAFLAFNIRARATGETFDAARAFTAVANFETVTKPLSGLIQALPFLFASLGSFARIDEYLSMEERTDYRLPADTPPKRLDADSAQDDPVLLIRQGAFSWVENKDVLRDIDLSIPRARLTCISGPVGCGKSTLCLALLGECRITNGEVITSVTNSEIAFCDQTVHLRDTSIRNNIIGQSSFDRRWYDSVVRACALVDDLASMPNGDASKVGSGGIAISGGQKQRISLARALYARKSVMVLDDILSALDHATGRRVFQEVIGPMGITRKLGITVILATHDRQYLKEADHIVLLSGKGTIAEYGDPTQFGSTIDELDAPASVDHKNENMNYDAQYVKMSASVTTKDGSWETLEMDDIGSAVYRYYLRSAGWLPMSLVLILGVLAATLFSAASYWLKVWTAAEMRDSEQSTFRDWAVYAVLQTATLAVATGLTYHALVPVTTTAGVSLHRTLLRTVSQAPWTFLSATDTGATLSRFSTDLQVVDSELPFGMLNFTTTLLFAIAHATLMAISFPWTAFAIVGASIAFYILQRSYHQTSVRLRMLELEAKSAFTSHHTQTISGLATLRAFGWMQNDLTTCRLRLDEMQNPAYLTAVVQVALISVVQMLIACLAIMVSSIAVIQRTDPGLTGLALTQLMSLPWMIQGCMLSWAQVGTSMGAVGRIKSFVERTPSEDGLHRGAEVPADWPSRGRVEFQRVTAGYRYVHFGQSWHR